MQVNELDLRVVSLRAVTWEGRLPMPGEHVATGRGLWAYRILEVRENRRRDPRSRAAFRCLKVPAASLPPDAVIHAWAWSPRG